MNSRMPYDFDPWARQSHFSRPLSRYNVVLHRKADMSLLVVIQRTVMDLTHNAARRRPPSECGAYPPG